MAIDLFTIGKFTIHGYGLMIGIGFLLAVLLGSKLAKNRGLSDDDFVNIAIIVLLFGFLGGKLLYVIVEFKTFLEAPLSVLGSEGFVVYGGIMTGILSVFVYSKIKKLEFTKYMDLVVSVVPLGQAFGRIGCFLAGCCYGKETHSHFGVVFPEGSLAPAGVRLIPTQLIMSAGDFIIFAIIMWFTKKERQPGAATVLYLSLYCVGRFAVEFLRNDNRGAVGALSTSQFISIIVGIVCLVLFTFMMRGKKAANKD